MFIDLDEVMGFVFCLFPNNAGCKLQGRSHTLEVDIWQCQLQFYRRMIPLQAAPEHLLARAIHERIWQFPEFACWCDSTTGSGHFLGALELQGFLKTLVLQDCPIDCIMVMMSKPLI